MPHRGGVSALASLGLAPHQELLYQRLTSLSGNTVECAASRLVISIDEMLDRVDPLVARGLVELADDRVRVPPLSGVISSMVAAEAARAATTRERLDELAGAIASLGAAASRPAEGEVAEVSELQGEKSSGGNSLDLLTSLIEHSQGDLLWWRPDAWRAPREGAMATLIGQAVASGRRSRAVYPAIALREAPDRLRARVDAGEEVRVVPELPTRLIVVGSSHAVLPEPLGPHDEPRLLIRQPAIVAALAMLFEAVWEDAVPVPDLDHLPGSADRGYLLRQLAGGAKDEQIARVLGLSLRTVRRRVAELLVELGVETRFQAGAEAVRRGWL